jgi:hypothetical protein
MIISGDITWLFWQKTVEDGEPIGVMPLSAKLYRLLFQALERTAEHCAQCHDCENGWPSGEGDAPGKFVRVICVARSSREIF